jgi:probable F420-dependent oxidoreductase
MSVMAPTPRRLRFGVVNEVVHETAGGWLGHVRRVEESGADTILIRDHLAAGPFGPQLAPLAAAAAAAAHTSRLRVGTMVLSNDYRHPALVAHEAATIDRISEGRFELGLGAGWLAGEYQQMGIPFEPARTRIARLEEAVQIITALLAGQTVTVHGAHYGIESLALPVAAIQRPRPPLLIGGGGPRMLALAARHADIAGILPAPIRGGQDSDDPADRSPAALRAKLDILQSAAGQRFGDLELSTFATFEVTGHRRRDTEALIARRGWHGISWEQVCAMPSVFIGSAGQITQDLHARRSAYGLSYYVTTDHALDHLAQVIECVGAE